MGPQGILDEGIEMPMGDLLFLFSEWLRGTPIIEFSLWASELPLSIWIGSHFFAIPLLQTLHILAIAAAFGSVLMINLRILGLAAEGQALERAARRYVPWIWTSLGVLLVSGVALVIGEPLRELINPIFWIKMALVIGLILLSLWFQAAVRKISCESAPAASVSVRAAAAAIIVMWCVIIFAGRWIAYAPV